MGIKCPYGQPGDRLWVKETWAENDKGQLLMKAQYTALREVLDLPSIPIKWQSSMFMPRKHSRILLEITEVRGERVQQINEVDIAKEGIDVTFHEPGKWGIDNPCATAVVDLPNGHRIYSTARGCFMQLWDSLNAKRGYPWQGNWWVWPISFKLA